MGFKEYKYSEQFFQSQKDLFKLIIISMPIFLGICTLLFSFILDSEMVKIIIFSSFITTIFVIIALLIIPNKVHKTLSQTTYLVIDNCLETRITGKTAHIINASDIRSISRLIDRDGTTYKITISLKNEQHFYKGLDEIQEFMEEIEILRPDLKINTKQTVNNSITTMGRLAIIMKAVTLNLTGIVLFIALYLANNKYQVISNQYISLLLLIPIIYLIIKNRLNKGK